MAHASAALEFKLLMDHLNVSLMPRRPVGAVGVLFSFICDVSLNVSIICKFCCVAGGLYEDHSGLLLCGVLILRQLM